MQPIPRFDVEAEYTSLFPEILHGLNCSLLISTYQAGKVIVVGVHDGKLQISYLDFPSAMGIAVGEHCVAIGSARQIHFLHPAHDLLETHWPDGRFDAIYVARSSIYIGKIDSHEIAWGADGLWVVNTLFSALCTLQHGALFKPRWNPPFIKSIGEHDCCHLNGLAMRSGQPAYASMIAPTAMPAGWREHKRTGGCIQDVATSEMVCSGLAMPHSPRCYADQLWALNSGHGHFGYVDLNTGKFAAVEFLPGFLRGLSFAQNFAFVGLSRGRETNLFGGLPITKSPSDMRCGVGIVDLTTGRTAAVLQFHSGVDEIFAVEVQLGCRNPLYGGSQQGGKEREVWLF